MTNPNPGQDQFTQARAELQAQTKLMMVEGEMLGEEPQRYAADVRAFARLESALRAYDINKNMVLNRMVSPDYYPEGVSDTARRDYVFSRVDLRSAVTDLAQRWATEQEGEHDDD